MAWVCFPIQNKSMSVSFQFLCQSNGLPPEHMYCRTMRTNKLNLGGQIRITIRSQKSFHRSNANAWNSLKQTQFEEETFVFLRCFASWFFNFRRTFYISYSYHIDNANANNGDKWRKNMEQSSFDFSFMWTLDWILFKLVFYKFDLLFYLPTW